MTATCPRCGARISQVATRGPGESYASPCGHRVDEQVVAALVDSTTPAARQK